MKAIPSKRKVRKLKTVTLPKRPESVQLKASEMADEIESTQFTRTMGQGGLTGRQDSALIDVNNEKTGYIPNATDTPSTMLMTCPNLKGSIPSQSNRKLIHIKSQKVFEKSGRSSLQFTNATNQTGTLEISASQNVLRL